MSDRFAVVIHSRADSEFVNPRAAQPAPVGAGWGNLAADYREPMTRPRAQFQTGRITQQPTIRSRAMKKRSVLLYKSRETLVFDPRPHRRGNLRPIGSGTVPGRRPFRDFDDRLSQRDPIAEFLLDDVIVADLVREFG